MCVNWLMLVQLIQYFFCSLYPASADMWVVFLYAIVADTYANMPIREVIKIYNINIHASPLPLP